MKKILLIDDSALMRRSVFDIIEKTGRYTVGYYASSFSEAVELLRKYNDISIVICSTFMHDTNVDKLFSATKSDKSHIHIIMWGDVQPKGIEQNKYYKYYIYIGPYTKVGVYSKKFEGELTAAVIKINLGLCQDELKASRIISKRQQNSENKFKNSNSEINIEKKNIEKSKEVEKLCLGAREGNGRKIVALACSTGGPKALHNVITKLPSNLAAPVLIVQHMPVNFTRALADRLDGESAIKVKEAEDYEELQKGVCYIAKGGQHMVYSNVSGKDIIRFNDEPAVQGLKPYANIMYKSLCGSKYDEIICVVLTGMGSDGCEGINELANHNKIYVIAQNEETSTVYGMPKAIYESGIVDNVCGIDDVAHNIIKKVGVV